jgi:hypothetical protein
MGKCKANILCLNAREECRLMLTIPEVFIFWVLKGNSWSPEVVQHFQKVDCWQGQTISSVCFGLVHKLLKSNTTAWVEHIHRFVLELLLNLRLFPTMLSEYSLRFILLSPSHKYASFVTTMFYTLYFIHHFILKHWTLTRKGSWILEHSLYKVSSRMYNAASFCIFSWQCKWPAGS